MRALIDINVVPDAMLQRPPWHNEADAVLQAAALGQITCATTSLTPAQCSIGLSAESAAPLLKVVIDSSDQWILGRLIQKLLRFIKTLWLVPLALSNNIEREVLT